MVGDKEERKAPTVDSSPANAGSTGKNVTLKNSTKVPKPKPSDTSFRLAKAGRDQGKEESVSGQKPPPTPRTPPPPSQSTPKPEPRAKPTDTSYREARKAIKGDESNKDN